MFFRKAAVWISEMYIKQNDKEILDQLARLKDDPSADVCIGLDLSLRTSKYRKAQAIVKEFADGEQDNEMMQFSYTTFVEAQK